MLKPYRSRTGRKGPYAHYYLQIQPGGSFVGGGIWHPEAQPLALLRRDVDLKSHKLKKVLMDPGIRRECFKGIPNDEKKAVKAFVSQNSENMLKTKPKVRVLLDYHLYQPRNILNLGYRASRQTMRTSIFFVCVTTLLAAS